LPVDHLLGDWWGLLPRLEDNGITPTLNFVSDMMGNPVGGMRQGFTEADNVGFNAVFDLEKRCGIEGGTSLYSMSQRSGVSLSNNYIGNIFGVQQVFARQLSMLSIWRIGRSCMMTTLNSELAESAPRMIFLSRLTTTALCKTVSTDVHRGSLSIHPA